jgi:hypothetical protein
MDSYGGGHCGTHQMYQVRYVSRPSLAAHRREPLLQFPAATTLDSALEPTLSLPPTPENPINNNPNL